MKHYEMNDEEFIKETEKQLKTEKPSEKKARNPLVYIIAIFLLLILILMIFPIYSIKWDPAPRNIPELQEVIPKNFNMDLEKIKQQEKISTIKDYQKFIDPTNPFVKIVADRIVSRSCPVHKTCHAKALFYFVRDNFDYVNDPSAFELVKTPSYSFFSESGDCDDASVLLASLLESVGIKTRLIFIPGHVWVQAMIPNANKNYKVNDKESYSYGWIDLDATCKNCEFGEIPVSNKDKKRKFI